MLAEGVIYRIGAVVNHHKLGFTANAMFVCQVCEAKVVEAGRKLAKLNIVSHCYQRKRFPGWVYNLYAMMHARSHADIQRAAEKFAKSQGIKKWELLQTVKTLKK
jgi:DNA-binding Lrp family transcriptional regulator